MHIDSKDDKSTHTAAQYWSIKAITSDGVYKQGDVITFVVTFNAKTTLGGTVDGSSGGAYITLSNGFNGRWIYIYSR